MSVASGSGGSPAVGRSGSSASARRSIVGSARSGSPAVGSSGSANVMPPTRRLSTRTPGISAAAANSDGARPSTPGTGSKTDSVTATDSAAGARAGTPTRAQTQSSTGGGGVLSAAEQLGEITSPHELTEWVDIVLNQLEDKFDLFNGQVQDRMKEMSARIEALESSIQELVTGTAGGTAPPAT